MTIAQIELMSADVPITIYPKDKKGEKSASGKREFREMSIDEIEEKRQDYESRFGNGNNRITVCFGAKKSN